MTALRASTSSGRCEGFIGGLAVSDDIDPESFYAIDNTAGLNIIQASFGQRKVRVFATVSRATVLSGGTALNLPSEVPTGGGTGGGDGGTGGADGGTGGADGGTGGAAGLASPEIKAWTWRALWAPPEAGEGTLERVLTFVELRLSTTLRLIFEDGTSLVCEFQLRHDDERTSVMTPPRSSGGGCLPGGGGGDSDFD